LSPDSDNCTVNLLRFIGVAVLVINLYQVVEFLYAAIQFYREIGTGFVTSPSVGNVVCFHEKTTSPSLVISLMSFVDVGDTRRFPLDMPCQPRKPLAKAIELSRL